MCQIVGYTLSKVVGMRVCSELGRSNRALVLVLLIIWAQLALIAFAVVPSSWKVLAIFLNGLPLGMIWGLVVRYLEGRRLSELVLAGLSCSYIIASGVVKDVGRIWMDAGVSDVWMSQSRDSVFCRCIWSPRGKLYLLFAEDTSCVGHIADRISLHLNII